MSECECLATCSFFAEVLDDMPVTIRCIKRVFCFGNNSRCARYMVYKALGAERVPPDLFPTYQKQALRIIDGN